MSSFFRPTLWLRIQNMSLVGQDNNAVIFGPLDYNKLVREILLLTPKMLGRPLYDKRFKSSMLFCPIFLGLARISGWMCKASQMKDIANLILFLHIT